MRIDDIVKSKKLLLEKDAEGIVCGVAWPETLFAITKKIGFDETVDLASAIERWSYEYPGGYDSVCLVLFKEEVTNSIGRKGKDFWFPSADLELVPEDFGDGI